MLANSLQGEQKQHRSAKETWSSIGIFRLSQEVSDEAKKRSDRAGSVSESTFPPAAKARLFKNAGQGKSLSLTFPALKEGKSAAHG